MTSTFQRALCAVLPMLIIATAAIWAGGEEEEQATAVSGDAVMEGAYQEAPMLAAMVKAGQLPPVDERLPSNPKVVEPYDSIGQYGGTLRMIDVNNSMSIGLRSAIPVCSATTRPPANRRPIWRRATPGPTTTALSPSSCATGCTGRTASPLPPPI